MEVLPSIHSDQGRPRARRSFGKTPKGDLGRGRVLVRPLGGARVRRNFGKTSEGDLRRGEVLVPCSRRTYLEGVLGILSSF
jgi:hypothetical protein